MSELYFEGVTADFLVNLRVQRMHTHIDLGFRFILLDVTLGYNIINTHLNCRLLILLF